jgi:hypothetical protein
MIYHQTKLTPQTILEQFNVQHKDLKFTIKEMDNPITYLYLNLSNKQGQIEMEVYRKPTTDIAINNTSRNPKEHKLAAFKNWIHRLLMLPLNENSKKIELNTIINIAITNRY